MAHRRAGIIQSNYIPWKGYFDFIDSVDDFVLFDDVQYTRRDWRNRNRIKTIDGLRWLTIPVQVKGKYFQTIRETLVANANWTNSHAASLHHAYGRAPYFHEEWSWLEPLYASCEKFESLADINELFIRAICRRLQIHTPIRRSSDFPSTTGKNERLIALCKQLRANEYLSGPAAREYIDEAAWSAAGISVSYKSYSGYREYAQLYPPFEHAVSALDLIFNAGPAARTYLKSEIDAER